MMPTATTLQRASGYMKNPPLTKSWKTETSAAFAGGGRRRGRSLGQRDAAAQNGDAVIVSIARTASVRLFDGNSLHAVTSSTALRRSRRVRPREHPCTLRATVSYCFLARSGCFSSSKRGRRRPAPGSTTSGRRRRPRRPGARGCACSNFAFGEERFADLELGAGGGLAVVGGDRCLVARCGRRRTFCGSRWPSRCRSAREAKASFGIFLQEGGVGPGRVVVLAELGLDFAQLEHRDGQLRILRVFLEDAGEPRLGFVELALLRVGKAGLEEGGRGDGFVGGLLGVEFRERIGGLVRLGELLVAPAEAIGGGGAGFSGRCLRRQWRLRATERPDRIFCRGREIRRARCGRRSELAVGMLLEEAAVGVGGEGVVLLAAWAQARS